MNSDERQLFWDTLCGLHDNGSEHVKNLLATIKTPKYLCRFRSVSESTLLQLQENKLYYSSADYYDDPFDTFIHVDYSQINLMYAFLNRLLESGTPELSTLFKQFEPILGISTEEFLNTLKKNPLNLSRLSEQIKQIRTVIQKNLFSICFCESFLNETLWLKYANSYKGFALVYDVENEGTFLCGKKEECKNCRSMNEKPSLYPIYYSNEAYNATRFALASLLWGTNAPQGVIEWSNNNIIWEAERVSLIKKKCHEYDMEWRMIRPTMTLDRTCIKMKPNRIILGLRMPEYERKLVISAAKIAGVSNIEELYIDDSDQLTSRRIRGV